jgi:hypothetical protein
LDNNQNNLFDDEEFGLVIGRMEDYEDTEETPSIIYIFLLFNYIIFNNTISL